VDAYKIATGRSCCSLEKCGNQKSAVDAYKIATGRSCCSLEKWEKVELVEVEEQS